MANIKYNYYGLLGLSAEFYEDDPQKLSEILEKKIKEWKSNKKIEYQNIAYIHGVGIRKAIEDPVRWKSIYDEFRSAIEQIIEDTLVLFVKDNMIAPNDIKNIANRNNVSESFVISICLRKGYGIESSVKQKPKVDFTLEDLKPKSHLLLQEPQKAINALGANDLFDLLATTEISEININLSKSASKEKVIEALDELQKKWHPVQHNGPKSAQKSHIDRICSGFRMFLEKYPFEDYIRYLKYIEVKQILDDLIKFDIKHLSTEATNFLVDKITKFTDDKGKSRSLLVDFCETNAISWSYGL